MPNDDHNWASASSRLQSRRESRVLALSHARPAISHWTNKQIKYTQQPEYLKRKLENHLQEVANLYGVPSPGVKISKLEKLPENRWSIRLQINDHEYLLGYGTSFKEMEKHLEELIIEKSKKWNPAISETPFPDDVRAYSGL